MTSDWVPVFVLPNVQLTSPIECDIAALVPAEDSRLAVLRHSHPKFHRFLGRFSDNFGVKFEPAVLLLRVGSSQNFLKIEALAGFRDVIAVSTVAYNRALELRYPRGLRLLFSDAFAIYPWMLDKNYNDLIGNTPAILGIHEVTKFKGQSSPTMFRMSLDSGGIDEPLLTELLKRWHRRYEASVPDWEDIALFRSLNMAYHASLLPASTDTTFYDVGRLVSLWVSAFEILVHPGGNGRANRDKVFELIERTPWELKAIAELIHDTGGKTKVKRTLASWLYQALNDCRNNFLHGNPVERGDLLLPISNRTLFEYAAPLYRIALTAFLALTYGRAMPSTDDSAGLGAYIAEHMAFVAPQRNVEEAILTAIKPPGTKVSHQRRPTTRR